MPLKLLLTISLFFYPLQAITSDDIKVVVTAAFVSEKGLDIYDGITDYIGKKLNRTVSIVSGTTYEESDMLLENGIVQVGFICGLPYTQKHRQGKFSLVAMPVMAIDNQAFEDTPDYADIPAKYYSYTIVHKDSPITSWQDLKGKHYVYNDINSNSGYNMPRYKLLKLGATNWESYFSKVSVSGSHEESIRMVANGRADASSVDSLVLDYDRNLGDKSALNVKVIEVLFAGGAGIPPIVVNQSVSPELRQQMEEVLVNMHKDPEGNKLLQKALISHFVKPNDSNYDFIRDMEEAAAKAGFVDHIE